MRYMKSTVSMTKSTKKKSIILFIFIFALTVICINESDQTRRVMSENKINCVSSPDRWTSLLYSCAEKESIVAANGSRIEVTAGGQGAIAVKSWDRNEIKIRVVSEAWAETDEAARKMLESIDYKYDGKKLLGLFSEEKIYNKPWAVNFEITIPKNYELSLNTVNGAIFADDLTGSLSAKAVNGAVFLKQVSGKVNAKSLNGRVEARISGSSWEGESLNVESDNGEVAVYFPKNFSAQLNGKSGSGKIYVQDKTYSYNTLKKTLNDGGKPITAQSGNGDVKIYFQSE